VQGIDVVGEAGFEHGEPLAMGEQWHGLGLPESDGDVGACRQEATARPCVVLSQVRNFMVSVISCFALCTGPRVLTRAALVDLPPARRAD